MSGGTEFQEQGDVQEQPREVSEETKRVEQATVDPEAAVERQGDYQQAEQLETAFKELVQAAEKPAPETGDGGRETEGAAGIDANWGTDTGDQTESLTDQVSGVLEAVENKAEAIRGTIDELGNQGQELEEMAEGLEESRPVEGGLETGNREGAAVAATGDGEMSYEMRSDSQTGAQTVEERIESVESDRVSPPESDETVQLREDEVPASPGETESAEVQRVDVVAEVAAPSLELENAGEDISSVDAAKVLNDSLPPAGMGLPVDDSGDADPTISTDEQGSSQENGIYEFGNDGSATPTTVQDRIEEFEGQESFSPPDESPDEMTESSILTGLKEDSLVPDEGAGDAADTPDEDPDAPQWDDYASDEAYNAAVKEYNASLEETTDQVEGLDERLAGILDSIRLEIKALLAKGQELNQAREELKDIQSSIQELRAEKELVVDLIREVREENLLLANYLADLESGETLSVTVHAGGDPSSGDYSWTEETLVMDRNMIVSRIADNEDFISNLQGRISTLEEEINMQTSNLEGRQTDIEKLLKDIQKLSDRIQALQQQAAALAETLGQLYTPRKIPVVATAVSGDVSLSSSRQVTGSGGLTPAEGGLPLDD